MCTFQGANRQNLEIDGQVDLTRFRRVCPSLGGCVTLSPERVHFPGSDRERRGEGGGLYSRSVALSPFPHLVTLHRLPRKLDTIVLKLNLLVHPLYLLIYSLGGQGPWQRPSEESRRPAPRDPTEWE